MNIITFLYNYFNIASIYKDKVNVLTMEYLSNLNKFVSKTNSYNITYISPQY
jgi:hypothetical protein